MRSLLLIAFTALFGVSFTAAVPAQPVKSVDELVNSLSTIRGDLKIIYDAYKPPCGTLEVTRKRSSDEDPERDIRTNDGIGGLLLSILQTHQGAQNLLDIIFRGAGVGKRQLSNVGGGILKGDKVSGFLGLNIGRNDGNEASIGSAASGPTDLIDGLKALLANTPEHLKSILENLGNQKTTLGGLVDVPGRRFAREIVNGEQVAPSTLQSVADDIIWMTLQVGGYVPYPACVVPENAQKATPETKKLIPKEARLNRLRRDVEIANRPAGQFGQISKGSMVGNSVIAGASVLPKDGLGEVRADGNNFQDPAPAMTNYDGRNPTTGAVVDAPSTLLGHVLKGDDKNNDPISQIVGILSNLVGLDINKFATDQLSALPSQ